MMNTEPPLYLIDAYGLIYRSYFAFLSRPLRNKEGKNISALFGFMRTLVTLLDEGAQVVDENGHPSPTPIRPKRLAAVFDSRVPTFRHEQYPEYKATRQKTPEDLHAQVPLVEEALRALGVPIVSLERYEADDLIATLASRCKAEHRKCYILSSDKDLLQLVGDGVYQLRPSKGAGIASGSPNAAQASPQNSGKGGLNYELIGPEQVKAEWGVEPAKVLDLLSLIGDASDNVPGVKGVGEKTAIKLMARYGTLDGIYENIAGIEGAVGRKIAEGRDSAYKARSLIALDYASPIRIDSIDGLSVENIDRASAAGILLREGIRQLALILDPTIIAHAGETATKTESSAFKRDPIEIIESIPDTSPGQQSSGIYRSILDKQGLDDFLLQARRKKKIALDFETDSLDAWSAHPVGVSLCFQAGEAVYIPVVAHRGSDPFVDPMVVRSALASLLADPDITIIAHNAKFDYEVSRAWGLPHWNCGIWDTMVAAWLTDPERGNYSLESLASSWLGLRGISYESLVPKGETFDSVALDRATIYSAEDSDYAFRLKEYLEPKLQDAETIALFETLEMPLLPILAEMEGIGIKIESGTLREYGKELTSELGEIEKTIYEMVGHPFNIASTKQLQQVLFVERKLRTGKKTKTGFSTDVAVLEELAREDPVPERILRYRTLAKLKSTYVDTLADIAGSDGRLHTHYIQTGTATGRLSSRDPNLQNIPIRDEEGRRIRQAFIAEPGKLLVSADYSQIELVVLAHLSGDENLCAAFRDGHDVHRRTAALIFHIDEEAVRPDQRRIAKTINFGVMYGMSAFRLSNELGIGRGEAQAFIDAYFHTYSGIRKFIDERIKETEQTGYAQTILGRRRSIPTINSGNKTEKAAAERIAINTPIQGSAADIVKLAMLRLDKALRRMKSSARLLLQVHDELILEAAVDDADGIAQLAQKEMESAIVLKVPLRVEVEIGRRWGDFH